MLGRASGIKTKRVEAYGIFDGASVKTVEIDEALREALHVLANQGDPVVLEIQYHPAVGASIESALIIYKEAPTDDQ